MTHRLHHEEDMVVNLQHEQGKLKAVLNQEERQISHLEKIMVVIEKCEERSKPGSDNPLSLADCEEVFKTLMDGYLDEYKAFELSQLATIILFPLVSRPYLIQQNSIWSKQRTVQGRAG